MDILLIILGFILIIAGLIGCILPGLPGPFTAWLGLLVTMLSKVIPDNWSFIGITFAIVLIITVLDYIIPAMGTKKFGGSKYGIFGAIIGVFVGIFAPVPGGIIVGAFLGAFVGEYIKNNNALQAIKAAFGSLIGFLVSTGMQLIVTLVFLILYFKMLTDNWSAIQQLF
jgi:uncharacterized protein YqgC (DUF456 family)